MEERARLAQLAKEAVVLKREEEKAKRHAKSDAADAQKASAEAEALAAEALIIAGDKEESDHLWRKFLRQPGSALMVRVLMAEGLDPHETPYVKVSYGGEGGGGEQSYQTKPRKAHRNGVVYWEDFFRVEGCHQESTVVVEVWGHDYLSFDNPMGQILLRVPQVLLQQAEAEAAGGVSGRADISHPSLQACTRHTQGGSYREGWVATLAVGQARVHGCLDLPAADGGVLSTEGAGLCARVCPCTIPHTAALCTPHTEGCLCSLHKPGSPCKTPHTNPQRPSQGGREAGAGACEGAIPRREGRHPAVGGGGGGAFRG